jgi:hypothetical protein
MHQEIFYWNCPPSEGKMSIVDKILDGVQFTRGMAIPIMTDGNLNTKD